MNQNSWQVLIAVSTLAIVGLSGCIPIDKINDQKKLYEARQAELDAKTNARSTIVYAIKDIPRGAIIKVEALEEREMDKSKVPEDAVTSMSLIVGRKANRDVSARQIISQDDLAPAQ